MPNGKQRRILMKKKVLAIVLCLAVVTALVFGPAIAAPFARKSSTIRTLSSFEMKSFSTMMVFET